MNQSARAFSVIAIIIATSALFLPRVASPATPCCGVTSIGKDGVITAKETKGTRTFQFQVADPAQRRQLRVGAPVYANFSTKQVSLDGKKACCTIANVSVAANQTPTAAGAAAAGSEAQAVAHPMKSLRFDPSVAGGNKVQGHVELFQPPGPGGLQVALESSDPQLASVPSHITVTGGVTSAETGPMYMGSFPINTRPVHETKKVTIKARVGVQTLLADLRITPPRLKSAALHGPGTCDGSKKGKVTYTLTGPAPSGLKVRASGNMHWSMGGGQAYGSGSFSGGETVPTGKTGGSFRVSVSRCGAPQAGRCNLTGSARLEGPEGGSGAAPIGGSCGPPH